MIKTQNNHRQGMTMGLFDILPNGEQTKALGKRMRHIAVGDKVQPRLVASNGPSLCVAQTFAYCYVSDFTFADSAGMLHAVESGKYAGPARGCSGLPHFDYLGNLTTDHSVSPLMAPDIPWQDATGASNWERLRAVTIDNRHELTRGCPIAIRCSDGVYTLGFYTKTDGSLIYYKSPYGYSASARLQSVRY